MRVILGFLTFICLLSAADKFSGKWASSENGADGVIHIQLSEPAMVTFTLRGEEVKTKMLSMKKEDGKVEVRYEFDLGGTKLISTLTGSVSGDKFDGRYRTTTSDGGEAVDGGSFTASAQ